MGDLRGLNDTGDGGGKEAAGDGMGAGAAGVDASELLDE